MAAEPGESEWNGSADEEKNGTTFAERPSLCNLIGVHQGKTFLNHPHDEWGPRGLHKHGAHWTHTHTHYVDSILKRTGYFNSSITLTPDSNVELNTKCLTNTHGRLNVYACRRRVTNVPVSLFILMGSCTDIVLTVIKLHIKCDMFNAPLSKLLAVLNLISILTTSHARAHNTHAYGLVWNIIVFPSIVNLWIH